MSDGRLRSRRPAVGDGRLDESRIGPREWRPADPDHAGRDGGRPSRVLRRADRPPEPVEAALRAGEDRRAAGDPRPGDAPTGRRSRGRGSAGRRCCPTTGSTLGGYKMRVYLGPDDAPARRSWPGGGVAAGGAGRPPAASAAPSPAGSRSRAGPAPIDGGRLRDAEPADDDAEWRRATMAGATDRDAGRGRRPRDRSSSRSSELGATDSADAVRRGRRRADEPDGRPRGEPGARVRRVRIAVARGERGPGGAGSRAAIRRGLRPRRSGGDGGRAGAAG